MRAAERGYRYRERERAAIALATAYANPTPARTAASSGGWATCRRPMSARSTASNRHVGTGGRASSARSRRGWAGEIDEQSSVGLDFRRRRAALMRRPRGPAYETMGGGADNDLEALEDQNQQLKVALSTLVEENKRYRVNKNRLEGELLRADAKVGLLLSELEQAPGKRDQRLLNAARMEVEKCAVVRSLAKQKEHLQKMLVRQERELDAMKQTKEWSAVVEMTAATEEYFLEIRRLQRLLAQQQQGALANSPVAGESDREGGAAREAYVPNQCHPTQRRDSGVDDTVWIHRPETCEGDVSMSTPSPVDGVQHNRRILDAETAFTRGAGDVHNVVHGPATASAEKAHEFHEAHREDNGMPLHEWGASTLRRRPASPKRRVSPPRRARMATRAGREIFGVGNHKKLSEEPRGSRQTTQAGRGVFGRKQRGGSQSQVWIRADEARTSARGADARRLAMGVRSRPLSAPRTKRELTMTTMGDARRADSLSPFDTRRRQVASSDRGAPSGSGGGDSDACDCQKTKSADHRIPTVPAPTEPRSWETGEKRRPKPRSRSVSPRSSSSRNRTVAGEAFRVRDEVPTPTASATVSKHRTMGRKDESAGGDDCGDGGGSDAGSPGVAVAPRSSQRAADESESSPTRDDEGTSDDVYNEDTERRLSSSVPSRESLAAAASVENPSPTSSAKECEERNTAATQGQGRNKVQTADGSILDPAGSGDAENASKVKESRVAEGGELAHNLAESVPSPWGSFEAVGEPPDNEAKEQNTDEGSVGPVSWPTSTTIDVQENPNAYAMNLKNSTTRSTRNTKSGDGGEQQVTAAKTTGGLASDASARSGSNGSPNDGDNNSSSPLPEVGEDHTITRSISSHAATEKDHQGDVDVDTELETDKLLFDIEGDGDSVGDGPLIGENGAAPSEYGDDFDDFEDDED